MPINIRNPLVIPDHWRILLTGASSIHGWPVYRSLMQHVDPERLHAVRPPKMSMPDGPNVQSVCITDRAELIRIRETFKPTHVIHGAGVCDLDVCEEDPEWAARLNTDGSDTVADLFGRECHLLYLSTDLVFSGNSTPHGGYAEHHPCDPVSVAGKTFAAAEERIAACPGSCTIRLGLPLGASVTGTKGAFDWIENRFRRGLPVTLFHDEWRSGISCEEIGKVVPQILAREADGLFHLGGDEPVSLHRIGRRVLDRGGYPPRLLKSISRHEEIDGPPRIGNVALNSSKIKGILNS